MNFFTTQTPELQTSLVMEQQPQQQQYFTRAQLPERQHHSLVLEAPHRFVYTNDSFAHVVPGKSGETDLGAARGSRRIVPRPMPAEAIRKADK